MEKLNIPGAHLKREYQSLKSEIDSAITKVLEGAEFINGSDVKAFSKQFEEYMGGSGFAAPCASGTDALQLALMAIGIKPGDEVITTPFTFVATAEVVKLLGAEVKFVDIRADTFNINENLIQNAITEKTKAIIPVHLFGQCSNMKAICDIVRPHNIWVIEDCAQSIGAKHHGDISGHMSTVGCFSFFPSKNLGCYGDGGMVFSKNPNIANDVKCIANHGSKVKYSYDRIGVNSRLDTIQAAILSVKIKYLDIWNNRRRVLAEIYDQYLKGLPVKTPHVLPENHHVYNQYCILLESEDTRNKVLNRFKDLGVGSAVYYPRPLSDFEPYGQGLFYRNADSVSKRILSLPIHPYLYENEVISICKALEESL